MALTPIEVDVVPVDAIARVELQDVPLGVFGERIDARAFTADDRRVTGVTPSWSLGDAPASDGAVFYHAQSNTDVSALTVQVGPVMAQVDVPTSGGESMDVEQLEALFQRL